jgi:hypothetical protein
MKMGKRSAGSSLPGRRSLGPLNSLFLSRALRDARNRKTPQYKGATMIPTKTKQHIQTEKNVSIAHFQHYMHINHLKVLSVTVRIRVRHLAICSALKGLPISAEQAHIIRAGIKALISIPSTPHVKTRQPYGCSRMTSEQPLDQFLILPPKCITSDTHQALSPATKANNTLLHSVLPISHPTPSPRQES